MRDSPFYIKGGDWYMYNNKLYKAAGRQAIAFDTFLFYYKKDNLLKYITMETNKVKHVTKDANPELFL